MKLQRGTHDTNGRTIYYIKDPATYPIRTQLGRSGAGMQYWNGMWWTYNVTPSMLNKLRSLNIDVSIASASPSPVTQDSGSITNPVQSEQPSATESAVPESQSVNPESNSLFKVDRSSDGPPELYNARASEKAGFPVKKGIYTATFSVEIEGKEVPLTVSLNRDFMPGGDVLTRSQYNPVVRQGWRGFPIYSYTLSLTAGGSEHEIGNYQVNDINTTMNDKGKRLYQPSAKWNMVDEQSIAAGLEDRIRKILSDPNTKMYATIKKYMSYDARDPELREFLTTQGNEIGIVNYDIPLNGSSVSVPVRWKVYYPDKVFSRISAETALDKEKYSHAPPEEHLVTAVVPNEIKNRAEFDQWFNKFVVEDEDTVGQIKYSYEKYLTSFPFAEEDIANARAEMQDIFRILQSNDIDVEFLKNRLLDAGYIRPSKRGPSKYVIDHSAAIHSGGYGRSDRPENFYAVLAYYLSRKKRNVTSWSEINLNFAIMGIAKSAQRYGLKMSAKDIMAWFDEAANKVYRYIFDEGPPRSRTEQFNDFYGGNWGHSNSGYSGTDSSGYSDSGASGSLNDFVNFAVQHGISEELARSNPRQVRNQLALKLHPDVSKNPESLKDMQNLNVLFDKLPDQYKKAENWLEKVIFS